MWFSLYIFAHCINERENECSALPDEGFNSNGGADVFDRISGVFYPLVHSRTINTARSASGISSEGNDSEQPDITGGRKRGG